MAAPEPVQNPDILMWAIFDLGGADDFVDVEDAFYRAFELAPARFSWRTRLELPDFKKCAEALNRAERRRPRLLVKSGANLRKLSVEGQRWIEDNFDWLAVSLGESSKIRPPRRRRSSQIVARAQASRAYSEWVESGSVTGEKWAVAELLNCSPDSSLIVWERRLSELRAAAYMAGEESLLALLDRLHDEHGGWFGDG